MSEDGGRPEPGAKRRPGQQLSKDRLDDDADEGGVDPGSWKPAESDAVKARRKVHVRRHSEAPPPDPATTTGTSNPFAGIALAAPAAAGQNPFAGISLTAPAPAATPSQGAGADASQPTTTPPFLPAEAATPASRPEADKEATSVATEGSAPATEPTPGTVQAKADGEADADGKLDTSRPAESGPHAPDPGASSPGAPSEPPGGGLVAAAGGGGGSNPFASLGTAAKPFGNGGGFGGLSSSGGFGSLAGAPGGAAAFGGFGATAAATAQQQGQGIACTPTPHDVIAPQNAAAHAPHLPPAPAGVGATGTGFGAGVGSFRFGTGVFPPISAVPLGASGAAGGDDDASRDGEDADGGSGGGEGVALFGNSVVQPVVSLPEQEKRTGEEEEESLFTADGALFEFDTAASKWRERGRGEFKVNTGKGASGVGRARLVMRQAANLRLLLNAQIYVGMPLQLMASNVGITFGVVNAASAAPSGDAIAVKEVGVEKSGNEDASAALRRDPAAAKPEAGGPNSGSVRPSTWAVKIKSADKVLALHALLARLRAPAPSTASASDQAEAGV